MVADPSGLSAMGVLHADAYLERLQRLFPTGNSIIHRYGYRSMVSLRVLGAQILFPWRRRLDVIPSLELIPVHFSLLYPRNPPLVPSRQDETGLPSGGGTHARVSDILDV